MFTSDIQSAIHRLPVLVIHALGADDQAPEWKREFAEQVNALANERLHALVWEGVAERADVQQAMQTAHDIDPDYDSLELMDLAIELQPDLVTRIPTLIDELYAELTTA